MPQLLPQYCGINAGFWAISWASSVAHDAAGTRWIWQQIIHRLLFCLRAAHWKWLCARGRSIVEVFLRGSLGFA